MGWAVHESQEKSQNCVATRNTAMGHKREMREMMCPNKRDAKIYQYASSTRTVLI